MIRCLNSIALITSLSTTTWITQKLRAGIIDGPRDAGIDAAYIFINTQLLTDDFNFSTIRQPIELELYLIQAKNQDSFKEGAIDKLSSSLPLLLDYL